MRSIVRGSRRDNVEPETWYYEPCLGSWNIVSRLSRVIESSEVKINRVLWALLQRSTFYHLTQEETNQRRAAFFGVDISRPQSGWT